VKRRPKNEGAHARAKLRQRGPYLMTSGKEGVCEVNKAVYLLKEEKKLKFILGQLKKLRPDDIKNGDCISDELGKRGVCEVNKESS